MSNGYRRPRLSAGAYLGERTAPYLAPWLLTFAAMPVAVLIHYTIGTSPTWMAILAVFFTAMTAGTWCTWRGRKHETRVTATLLSGLMLGWVLFSGAGLPWEGNALKAYVVGGVCGSVFWCIRHAGITAGHDKDVSAADTGALGEKITAFKNSTVSRIKQTADQLSWRTTLEAPTTARDAQSAREQIAAVAGVGADQVTVRKVPGHEGQVDTALNRRQDTSRPLAYHGPSAPGQSIAAAPLWLGRRVDSSDIEWWLVGSEDPDNPRPLSHTKCTGVTGSGKTETICTAILDMRWRIDVVPVVADPAKFQQSFGDIEECLGLAARTEQQTKQLIGNLPEVVRYRAGLLGGLERSDGGVGYKQWTPECWTLHRIPLIFIDVEEAADVALDMDQELDDAVRKLRSVGIHLCLSMQTMPHDNLSRKTRGQFGQSLAHGQIEDQDARYALNANTREAGADPTKWGNTSPGCLYAEMVGTDQHHWSQDGRVIYMSPAEKQFSIEGSRQFWAEMDPGTYERLSYGLDEAEDDDEAPEEVTDVEDVNQELTPPPAGFSFDMQRDESREMDVREARARLVARLDDLARSQRYDLTFDDLADLPMEVGRTPGWVYNQLKLLVDAGVLKMYRPPKGKVVYTIIRKNPEASTG